MRLEVSFVILALAAAVAGCQDDRVSKVDELLSANQVRSEDPIPEPPPAASFATMPPMSIDQLGVRIGDRGASDLKDEKNREKLREVIKALPHKGERVTLIADKKARMLDVVETVWELGKAGVPEVLIKTTPRPELPTELVVVPESAVPNKPADCSVTAIITPANDVGVWGYNQTGGRKHRPGFSGPDLSSARETIEKSLRGCESDKAYFTASYNMFWEQAYNIGATIRFVDKDGKVKKLVLLGQEPVAGRPVTPRK
jgi:biopolymer transport protein ExbD